MARVGLPVEEFITGAFENALAPGRTAARRSGFRGSRPMRRWGYYKLCRKAGEFALAIGAVLDDRERGRFRAVIGATHGPADHRDATLRQVRRPDGTGLDEAAILRLFDRVRRSATARPAGNMSRSLPVHSTRQRAA